MNPYEQNGLDFLNKINYLVKRRDLKTEKYIHYVKICTVLHKI